MSKFKEGDVIRRINTYARHAPLGFEATVRADGSIVDAEGDYLRLNDNFWEVVKDGHKPHPHHDLIIAWAKGAEIEGCMNIINVSVKGDDPVWLSIKHPSWRPENEYRVASIASPQDKEITKIEQEMVEMAEQMTTLADRLDKLKE